jgi:hypothetical protein
MLTEEMCMTNDTDQSSDAIKFLIGGGLAIVGILTGQGALAGLVGEFMGGIRGNLVANQTERGIDALRSRWFTKKGPSIII